MVRQELDRRHQDAAVTLRRKTGHQIGEVGLHPLARLAAGALPAEGPALAVETGGLGHC